MPTSGDVTLELTAADACKSAAVELGAIGTADDLEDSEREEMVRRLNGMLKTWSVELNMFRETTATVTIDGGTGLVALPADILDISSIRYVQSATNLRTLYPWNRTEYFQLPNRATVGLPTIYYASKGADGIALRVWPVPAADIDVEIDYSRGAYAVTAPEETLDVPTEWQEAVIFGLASRSTGIFGTTRIDPAAVQRVDARSAQLYQRLLDADRPDSYRFEPDAGWCCG